MENRLVEVYVAKNTTQAYLLKSVLEEEAGIKAYIVGDTLQVAAGELPLGMPTAPRIWVSESDAPLAREIIEKVEHSDENQ